MKNARILIQRTRFLFIAVASFMFMFGASPYAAAQGKFKTGERVECDLTAIGHWQIGTVVPYLEKDKPVHNGDYYLTRVLIDSYAKANSYPEGVLCTTERMRLSQAAVKPAADQKQDESKRQGANAPQEVAGNQAGPQYKPGDRVECDPTAIGNWVKGTVLPYSEKDNPQLAKDKTGKYFYIHRVRLDNDTQRSGMCFTDRMRLLAEASVQPPPVDVPVATSPKGQPNPGSPWGARDPAICAPLRQNQAPSAAQAVQLLRCARESASASTGNLSLMENVRVEVGGPTTFAAMYTVIVMQAADTTKPVYPIRGSWTWSTCILRSDAGRGGADPNLNCKESDVTGATGGCWRTTFGDWKCTMNGTTGSAGPLTRPRQ